MSSSTNIPAAFRKKVSTPSTPSIGGALALDPLARVFGGLPAPLPAATGPGATLDGSLPNGGVPNSLGGLPGGALGVPGGADANAWAAMAQQQQNMMLAMAMQQNGAGFAQNGLGGAPALLGGAPPAVPQSEAPKAPREEPEEDRGRGMMNDPDILELFDQFHIDTRHMKRFANAMEKRQETFEGDMLKLWELCEQARCPEGMFVSKMREMEDGTFVGKTIPDKELVALSKKYGLDSQAESKLSDVLAKYGKEKRQEYMEELEAHMRTSPKPSAMVMMSLRKLGEGTSLGKPRAPAPGSYAEKEKRGTNDSGRGRDGGRDRDHDRGSGRDRERDRSNDRDRRERDRSRSRGRHDRDRNDRDRDRGERGRRD